MKSNLSAYGYLSEGHARLSAALERAVVEAGGVPLDVYEVLAALQEAPGQRLTFWGLADRIVLSRSGLTRRMARLEGLGYVGREVCPHDRRSFHAVLTEAGVRAWERTTPMYRAAVERHFGSRITEGEARQLIAIMRRVIGPLEKAKGCATRREGTP